VQGEINLIGLVFSVGSLLIGIFGGYWFNSINKKTDKNRDLIQDNVLAISNNTSELKALKKENEKAELAIRQGVLELISDMKSTAKTLQGLGISVGDNTARIQNLETKQELISARIRSRDKD